MISPIDIFAAGARDGVYPGGQLAASREGQWLVNAAVGKLGPNLEATHENVIYDLASLTKPLATTLLLGRALEMGLAKLNDPISSFLPGADANITLEHLLEHSTGYPPHERFDHRLPKDVKFGSWDAWRHIVFDAMKTPREGRPGARAEYGDLNFILLGAALEVIFSQPLSLAHAMLSTPLFYRDRRGSPALPPVRPKWPIAPTEDVEPGEVHDENARAMGGAAGHAGLFGTADAVLRVAEDLVFAYHGWRGGILAPETVRRLWQPSLVEGSTRTLGFDRPSATGSSTGGRWPAHSVGHLGFTGTSVWIEPDRALIVVLVTNRVCPTRANNMIRRLRPALYDAAWEAWSKAKPRAPSPERKAQRRAHPRTSGGVRAAPPEEGPTQRITIKAKQTKTRDERSSDTSRDRRDSDPSPSSRSKRGA